MMSWPRWFTMLAALALHEGCGGNAPGPAELDGAVPDVSLDLPLVIVDGDGTQVWRSDVDLAPPASYQAFGVDAGDLDGDGDVDLVISGDPANEPEDIHLFWNDGGQALDFSYQRVPDLLPGHDMRAAEMTWLPESP